MAENDTREPDFTGWATQSGLRCTDGRTIMPGAFKHMDKKRVPLVFMHRQLQPENILGHVILEDRAFGTYSKGYFNKSQRAQDMKHSVQNGDVDSLSIYANDLSERKVRGGREVYHGNIMEVSLVTVGANPGAKLDYINLLHSDGSYDTLDDEAIITTGLTLTHSDEGGSAVADTDTKTEEKDEEALAHAAAEAVAEKIESDPDYLEKVFGTMSEEQRTAALFVAGASYEAGQEAGDDNESDDANKDSKEEGGELKQSADDTTDAANSEKTDPEGILAHMGTTSNEGTDMTAHSVFDRSKAAEEKTRGGVLSHADQSAILDAARNGSVNSFKKHLENDIKSDSGVIKHSGILQHDGVAGVDYGVGDLDHLFPDEKMDGAPSLITRRVEWVSKVLGGVKKQPFAKIKSLTFDITAQEARAKGYIKGTEKKEEVVQLLKRTTGPTTIYKKQKLDRDDILDITDFDIVAWLKWEIRYMLDEEIARAILIGDGRLNSNPDKIKDPAGAASGDGIRSILKDNDLYAIKAEMAPNTNAEGRIEEITRARSAYRGSGTPSFYTTDAELTDMLLLKDKVGRRLYGTEAELASVLRVKEIVPVEVFADEENLLGILVNLVDYTVGANKGGELTFFSDFDIDFNQEKYLMETRISGALNKPKSAIVFTREEGDPVTPTAPSFNGETNTISIPTVAGVIYTIDDEAVTGSVVIEEDTTVEAEAASGKYIPAGTTRAWSFSYTD